MALERYERRTDPNSEPVGYQDSSGMDFRDASIVDISQNDEVSSKENIEYELSSFKTEMRDNMKQLISTNAAISEISTACSAISRISSENSTAITGMSATLANQSSKLEALDSAMERVKQDLAVLQDKDKHIVSV